MDRVLEAVMIFLNIQFIILSPVITLKYIYTTVFVNVETDEVVE
jgi:hypothetical protein